MFRIQLIQTAAALSSKTPSSSRASLRSADSRVSNSSFVSSVCGINEWKSLIQLKIKFWTMVTFWKCWLYKTFRVENGVFFLRFNLIQSFLKKSSIQISLWTWEQEIWHQDISRPTVGWNLDFKENVPFLFLFRPKINSNVNCNCRLKYNLKLCVHSECEIRSFFEENPKSPCWKIFYNCKYFLFKILEWN